MLKPNFSCQISLNAELPPEPEAPKKEEVPEPSTHAKAEAMEEEQDPESDLELDMTGVIGELKWNCFFSNLG